MRPSAYDFPTLLADLNAPPALELDVSEPRGAARRAPLLRLLDHAHEELMDGRVSDGMGALFDGLERLRGWPARRSWLDHALEVARAHPVERLLLEDPLHAHAARQPRGYPGDAELIDMLYEGHVDPQRFVDEATPLGQRLFRHMVAAPAAQGVRNRRSAIAERIDAVARRRPGIRVLSIASGHLRESSLSEAIGAADVREFVALDQDARSLEELRRSYPGEAHTLTCVPRAIGDLLGDRLDLGTFDLVYSAGLYDYLPDGVATRLTTRLFDLVAPQGELVLFHFHPGIRDAAYMEAYLRWELLYRGEQELRRLLRRIPADRIAALRFCLDPTRTVMELRALKR